MSSADRRRLELPLFENFKIVVIHGGFMVRHHGQNALHRRFTWFPTGFYSGWRVANRESFPYTIS